MDLKQKQNNSEPRESETKTKMGLKQKRLVLHVMLKNMSCSQECNYNTSLLNIKPLLGNVFLDLEI